MSALHNKIFSPIPASRTLYGRRADQQFLKLAEKKGQACTMKIVLFRLNQILVQIYV